MVWLKVCLLYGVVCHMLDVRSWVLTFISVFLFLFVDLVCVLLIVACWLLSVVC